MTTPHPATCPDALKPVAALEAIRQWVQHEWAMEGKDSLSTLDRMILAVASDSLACRPADTPALTDRRLEAQLARLNTQACALAYHTEDPDRYWPSTEYWHHAACVLGKTYNSIKEQPDRARAVVAADQTIDPHTLCNFEHGDWTGPHRFIQGQCPA